MFEIIVFLSIIALDQTTKVLLSSYLTLDESLPIVENIFHLTLVHNTGIAFGMFKNQTALFIVISILTIGLIAYNIVMSRKREQLHRVERLALFLILAGSIGNLFDRIRLGYVIDFLDFRVWPVFNVADSAITIGVILILLRCFRLSAK